MRERNPREGRKEKKKETTSCFGLCFGTSNKESKNNKKEEEEEESNKKKKESNASRQESSKARSERNVKEEEGSKDKNADRRTIESSKARSERNVKKEEDSKDKNADHRTIESSKARSERNVKKEEGSKEKNADRKQPQTFTLEELVVATRNFSRVLGEGGFGKVYKGYLKNTNQVVAVKQLDPDSCQGFREFLVEVLMLSLADHENLVKLIGYCVEEDQRILVYEYMPLGSLEDHLFDLQPGRDALDWNTRMKIAAGAVRGLQYLHEKMKPAIIYRDLKCSNILLGDNFHPKLSDFGLAKVGPTGDKSHVSTRVMGTLGYCAPDYMMTGKLNFKSDVYSFGVVLLELITGRRVIDNTRPKDEQNLVEWAKPLFKDRTKFSQLVDPLLRGHYPSKGLYRCILMAELCVQERPRNRPTVAEILTLLNYLASRTYNPHSHSAQSSRSGSESSSSGVKKYDEMSRHASHPSSSGVRKDDETSDPGSSRAGKQIER